MSNVDQGKNQDLQGNAPDRSRIVLLLVDVINDLDFPRNEKLVVESVKLGQRMAELKRRCRQAGIPAIYIHDNYGRWRSDFPRCFAILFDPMHRGGRWLSNFCRSRKITLS
jgi:nicotinamidase-related amidase